MLEPDMCLALSCSRSLLIIHIEHLRKQALQFFAQLWARLILSRLDLFKHFISAGSSEWQLADHEHVKNASKRPNVTLVRIVAIEHFWSHEVGCARVRLHMHWRIFCETEVHQAHFTVSAKHDIFWLDIAVRNSESMAMLKSLQTLQDNVCSPAFSIRLSFFDAVFVTIEEFASRAQLHDQVQVVLVIVRLKVLDNVGVVNLPQQINLIHDRRQIFRRHFVFAEHFDCDLVFWAIPIYTLVNFAKCTFSENVTVNVVALFQLMDTGGDVDFGGLLSLLEVQMMLSMASLNLHALAHLWPVTFSCPAACSTSRGFTIEATHW